MFEESDSVDSKTAGEGCSSKGKSSANQANKCWMSRASIVDISSWVPADSNRNDQANNCSKDIGIGGSKGVKIFYFTLISRWTALDPGEQLDVTGPSDSK